MQDEFEMSMACELIYFLELQVKQFEIGLFIYQAKYKRNLVKKFGMENSKEARTLLSKTTKLARDDSGKKVDSTQYICIIRSLLYLIASKPNFMFSVGICAQSQADPKESHLLATKRVIKYVK